MNDLVGQLQGYFQHYGYWTLAVALLLENAGVPVPGETILLVASVLASTQHSLHLPAIILVGTLAAVLGDNLGYGAGRWGGRPLLERYRRLFRVTPHALARGERLFQRYGAVTVFLARFVFGLRMLAGPLAGVLRMHWQRFLTFNVLGAATWVLVIASLGYFFGGRLPGLVHTMRTLNLVLLALLVLAALFLGKRLLARLGSDEEVGKEATGSTGGDGPADAERSA